MSFIPRLILMWTVFYWRYTPLFNWLMSRLSFPSTTCDPGESVLGDDDDVLYPERTFQHNTVKTSAPEIDPVRMRTERTTHLFICT